MFRTRTSSTSCIAPMALAFQVTCLIYASGLNSAMAGHEQAASIGGRSFQTSSVPTGANGQVYAYSEAFNFVVNQVVTQNGVPVAAPLAGRGFNLLPPFPKVPSTVTSGLFAKAAGTAQDIDSKSTGNVAPIGVAHGLGRLRAFPDGTTQLSALADVTNNFLGFGRAEDPIYFAPGLNHIRDTLSGVVLTADKGTLGSAFEMTLNSSIPGLSTLYTLDIAAPGGLNSANDLTINFVSNPLLGLDDSAIDGALRAGFSVSGDTATQTTPFTLSYSIDPTQSYSLSNSVSALAVGVPEPSSLILAGIGVLCALAYSWRRAAQLATAA